MDRALIERIVAEVIRRVEALGEGENAQSSAQPPVRLVTEELVLEAAKRQAVEIRVVPGAIVTPLARDALRRAEISLAEVSPGEAGGDSQAARQPKGIALGADHRGYHLKEELKAALEGSGREVEDCGAFSQQPVAYAEIAEKVAREVSEGRCATGIIVDGGGGTSAIVANKVEGIRAVACHDVTSAQYARAHVDANVLCLGAGALGDTVAREIVATWLGTPFEGGECADRVRKIEEVERRQRYR
jgi:ribose 5-phosphate isomerase B